MPKPSVTPKWATNALVDPVSGTANKLEPNFGLKADGLNYREPLARQHLNYQFDLINKWIEYFDEVTSGALTPTLEAAYPVGKVHLSTNNANPATYFGFGVWNAISQGRAIFGVDTGDSDFNTVKETGGSKTHSHGGVTGNTTLTVDQIPPHNHDISPGALVAGSGDTEGSSGRYDASGGPDTTSIQDTGGGDPHNHTIASASNLPPYMTLYVWERTA